MRCRRRDSNVARTGCQGADQALPIDSDTVHRLQRSVPKWVKAVREAKPRDADFGVILTLDAFADDPQLLFDALWFAHSEGVRVTLAPS